jgi:putative spermidine/putrescine transport system substrate-binding protein
MNATGTGKERRFSRRDLTMGIGALAGVSLLSACGSNDSPDKPTPTPEPDISPTATQESISTPVAGYLDAIKWKGRTLSIATWGGDFEDAQNEAFFQPFEDATGVQIELKTADVERMKDQVNNQNVTWDLITVPMENVLSLSRDSYLASIDYKIVDRTPLFDEFALQHGVGVACYSTVMIYDPAHVTGPAGWQAFWNVTSPPQGEPIDPVQARTLSHSPVGTFEFALLADGVTVDKLYPLDIPRAFASLEKIRNNVVVWYEDGKQPVEIVQSGTAGMGSAWNVRINQFGDQNALGMVWAGGMLSADAWVIPSGAPNTDVAMDFINFATRAVPSANFSRLVPFGPVNVDSIDLIRSDRRPFIPTAPENKAIQFVQNWNWWADNINAVSDQFDAWLIEGPGEGTVTAGA